MLITDKLVFKISKRFMNEIVGNSISQFRLNLLDKSQYKSDLKQEEDLRKHTPPFTNLYSSESLYKGRPAAQDSTVLRIRIKRWGLRSLLLRPVPPTRKTL